jgi:adenine/guanine phosphoribosyltransferase-like PRPP-binding protein
MTKSKNLIKHLLRENLEIDEEFIVKNNTIFFTEPFDRIKSFNIGNRKVYAMFGEIDYYSGNNKEAIKAIKNISNIITKNPKSYSNLLKEFNRRFNTIPELASSEKLLGVETSSPVISDLSNAIDKPFINNAFTKIDKTLKMKNIDIKDREKISNLFELSFDLNDNSKVCVIDDFMTTGTSFKNAFNLIPQEIEAIGVCLFRLIS